MANPNKLTGRVEITVVGLGKLKSREGAKLNTGGVERETVTGDAGVHGFTEKTVAPSVECEISHDGKTSLTSLNAIDDATLVFETDTGCQYVLRHAWLTKPCELGRGAVALKFDAMTCEEL